ncbi:uncharacterized protein NECHADRAFT_98651 [Fusarium vanettenii 77-13-4]|uniref:Expressed protein n=1 Tax=Fusarium vanettenii (strain ATCC MYA-4622 / CBS 123669 / FGSC 9596 / NRRL 45880 / 77-13-4) TaxID=660122 RepID=C7YK10_FUSV7|nr:uncharacterized protein NECHADRAFT_98651 [Fusarium vanettenii 77-13-4]EEU47660.1 expressed protein [Fusarium vanettenii 77-13-4]
MPTLTPNVGLSPYHDGRIRNPVPSKLKGKTDGRQGNFSVMQIDVPRPEMTERDLAAKRTSEGTAAAARLANSQGYRHPKRPRPNVTTPAPPVRFRPYPTPVLPAPPRPIPQPPPLAPAIPIEKAPVERAPADRASAEIPSTSNPPTQATSPSIQEISPPPQAQETDPPPTGPSGLSAHDTKTEQARLLTLLRSLHPILVVDQLCKALAYFGGIPGAPPPADGVFPRSAGTNGPGSLFVAWISEIFPQLDSADKAAVTQTPPAIPPVGAPGAASIANSSAANAAPVTVKRSRGRPKGSKSSKVRKDKGIKKKVVTGSETTQTNDATATQSTPAEQEPEASQPPTTTGNQGQAATTAVAQANSNSIVQPTTPHVGKKRGRPKGSKNKPKSQSGTQNGVYASYAMAANSVVDSPLSHKTASNQQDANPSANVGNTGAGQNGMTTNSVEPEPNGSVLVQEAIVASDADNNVDQPPLPTPISTQTTPIATSRKRKPLQQTPQTNVQAMTTPNTLQVPDAVPRSGNSPRTQNAKRRRVSEEMGQNVVLSGTESHSTGAEASDSPTMVPNGQPSSASSSFDSQGQINQLGSGVNHRPQQLLPHQRQQLQQQQQHQQQRQNLNLHQFDQNQQPQPQPQQSPDMGLEQPNQTQQMAPAAANRPRNRLPGTQAHMSNMAAQAVYKQHYQQRQQQQQQQRQMANHFGQANGPPFSRTMGSNSPTQFQQQQHPTNAALGYSGRPSLSQHQHPQQQPHQQHPQTQPDESPGAPNMAQFQDFNGQGYLDMDYSMNTGTAVGFDSHTQLEAALAEPDMRDRIYHAIGR